jgi:hypothetical protein
MGDVGGGGKCLRRRLGQCRGGRGRACGAGWLHADAVPARTDLDQWPDVQEHGLRSGKVGRDQPPHDGPVCSRAAQKFPGVDRRGIHRSRKGEAQDDHRGIGRPRIERHARCRATIAEAGLPGFRSITWFGLVAPPGTSDALADKINRDVVTIVKSSEVGDKLRTMQMEPIGSSRREAADFFADETKYWGKIVKDANVTLD